MKRESPGSEIRINRLEALTDGVFAIAMTILVLSLEVPSRSQVTSQSELVQNIMSKGYQFLSYFISFFVIGSIWISTIRRTHILNKTDYKHLWLNMLNLFFVTTIPFTTSLLGDYGEYEFAEVLFHLDILILETIALVQWQYLMNNKDLIREDAIDDSNLIYYRKVYIFHVIVPLLGIAVSVFTPVWSNLVYLVIFFRVFFIRR
ncbi:MULTISPECIES: TMEM175 family protein [Mesotoga]|uniref:Putative integral membrane protein n=2 Tax=Mesotoga prima TaxID=1184387 RepID=I2F6C0_9BACT|nr:MULTISPECIES: TMEM175 family protein [Mesotoga]MCP5457624.1 DUF1211 domain-containing protein [Thermotogota bacterium]MDK2944144.1 potassium channel family protein [Mesotoga sp.]AFK07473.1 putative integral membrane protein [Mesotoga prima MesG1.Ag.4.2]RLL84932.1 hypothetical protein Y696_11830 [Mesotoga sp. H07pep.5.4]HNQ71192.1 TMEM175 family protein [Mesotoga prima]